MRSGVQFSNAAWGSNLGCRFHPHRLDDREVQMAEFLTLAMLLVTSHNWVDSDQFASPSP